MPIDNTPRRFTQDEANAILRRALDRQGTGELGSLTYEDLMETAKELGIDPSQIEAAVEEQESEGSMERARQMWLKQRKKKFFEHLRSYIIVNLALFLFAMITGGMWFLWVLVGWGIGILFDASDTFYPKEKDIERGARRLLDRQTRQRHREERQSERLERTERRGRKSLTIDSKTGRIIIEKGDKRIEIG